MAREAVKGLYNGEEAIWLRWGALEAAVLPGTGANLIAFRDTSKAYHYIREPKGDEWQTFKKRPMAHGIPILFPPNRYDAGKFTVAGREYALPVNEAKTGNHLHGFLFDAVWPVSEAGTDETSSYVELAQNVDEEHAMFTYFPHTFTMTVRYALSDEGLRQTVTIENKGAQAMPAMLGFHTAVSAPFAPGSTSSDVRFRLTIGERWELNDRMLPTGRFQPLLPEEEKMKTGEAWPFFAPMDNHYSAQPQQGRNYMELVDSRVGHRFVYETSDVYKHWMVWNSQAVGGFFCPEPQTSMVNAPNMDLPAEVTGLIVLEPGETFEGVCRLYGEELK